MEASRRPNKAQRSEDEFWQRLLGDRHSSPTDVRNIKLCLSLPLETRNRSSIFSILEVTLFLLIYSLVWPQNLDPPVSDWDYIWVPLVLGLEVIHIYFTPEFSTSGHICRVLLWRGYSLAVISLPINGDDDNTHRIIMGLSWAVISCYQL